MGRGLVGVLLKIGLISDEFVVPRKLEGLLRAAVSLVSVAFSLFFIYVAFFGPPVSEVFKGTFMLGVIVLSILIYRSRSKPFGADFVWLDEFFILVDTAMISAAFAVWAYWFASGGHELWRQFVSPTVWLVAAGGAAAGVLLYIVEGWKTRTGHRISLSDLLYLVGSVVAIVWWVNSRTELTENVGGPVPVLVVVFSAILVTTSFDIARRIVGPIIPLIGILFFVYSFEPIAQNAPGLLKHLGYPLDRVMEFLMLGVDGITGLILQVFATYIVIFVVLGAFLEKTGLGSLIIDAAYRLTGKFTGGPGLAAVTSSGLFGMISGSGVANVVTTGTFTIPLMRRVGYSPAFAGAVEASASTGGAYMPPIMGAGAFLLAELTETSYFEVMKLAVAPALLYYLSVGLIVYLRAARYGLTGVPVEELPAWARVLPRLHLLLPIPIMVWLLIAGDSPFLAAAKCIVFIIILRVIDILVAVETPWSQKSWLPYLGLSVLMAAFVYMFGTQVGAPFNWPASDFGRVTLGDSLFWLFGTFIVLKMIEIIFAGGKAEMTALPATGLPNEVVETHVSNGAPACLSRAVVEIGKNIWESLEAGARNVLTIGCIAGVLGILLSSATQSDLPGRVSILLVELSFGFLPLTIFWVIVTGYIIGMGLPVTAAYVILAVFSVGALAQLGVPAMSAHMISYWVAVVSGVTPPVALAAYAASAIAKSDPVKTGNEAVRLSSMIFITPLLFVYTPILVGGTTVDYSITLAASIAGVVAWATFLEGLGPRPVSSLVRTLLGLSAAIMLAPIDRLINWVTGITTNLLVETYVVGAILFVVAVVLHRRAKGETTGIGVT